MDDTRPSPDEVAQNPWSDDYFDEDLHRALAYWRNKAAGLMGGTTKAEWEAKADNISAALEERRAIARAKRHRKSVIVAGASVVVAAIGIIVAGVIAWF